MCYPPQIYCSIELKIMITLSFKTYPWTRDVSEANTRSPKNSNPANNESNSCGIIPILRFSTFSHQPPYPSLFIFPSIVDSPPLVNLWYYAFLTQICAFFPLRLSTRVIDVCCYAQVLLLMAVYRICFYTRSNSDYCTALLGLIRIEYEYFQQHSAATF